MQAATGTQVGFTVDGLTHDAADESAPRPKKAKKAKDVTTPFVDSTKTPIDVD